MSYISGVTLSQIIDKQGPLPTNTVVSLGKEIASALAYAHQQGIIHRDLKPDNIMIDRNGRPVVMDFGIARTIHDPSLTLSGTIVGTPLYMSPEQAMGKNIDCRSDIYSLGLLLYKMTTKTLPFISDDLASLLYMHVHETPKPPYTHNPNVPKWLSDIILTCIAKNPEERYSSALDVCTDLENYRASHLVTSRLWEKSKDDMGKTISMNDMTVYDSHDLSHVRKDTWTPMRREDVDPGILKLIEEVIGEIPELPGHIHNLIDLSPDSQNNIKEIARIVSADPALVSTIIKIVNSSYYGLPQKTSNLPFAIVRLGLTEIKRIALRFSLPNAFNKDWSLKGYSTKSLWEHSYLVSRCAEYIGKMVAPKNVGNLMTLGILHDIGKYPLFRLAVLMEKKGIKSLRPQKSPQQPYLIGKEETIFSVNHCIVGGMLAEKWGFPARIFSVLECHHHPSFWDIESIPLDYVKDIATICISDLIINYIQGKKNLLPEPEPEFFELIELRPPLENLVTTSLRQTIDSATKFLGTTK